MKSKLLKTCLNLGILFLSSAALASSPAPEKCPSVSSIQNAAFIGAQLSTNNKYSTLQISYFDTPVKWGFAISNIDAGSNQAAIALAKNALKSLAYAIGPVHPKNNDDKWACIYSISNGYNAMAVTLKPEQNLNAVDIINGMPKPFEVLNSQ